MSILIQIIIFHFQLFILLILLLNLSARVLNFRIINLIRIYLIVVDLKEL